MVDSAYIFQALCLGESGEQQASKVESRSKIAEPNIEIRF